MPFSRRGLLRAAAAMSIGLGMSLVAARAGEAIDSAAAALRPRPDGTSATRCATCGARDHAMLDPRCPAARRVI